MYSKLPIIVVLVSVLLGFVGMHPSESSLEGRTATTATSATGVSTGATTTGGSTTASTGGSFTSSGNTVYISNLDEKRSADTYAWVSGSPGSWQHLTGRHIAGIKFHSNTWSYGGSPGPHVTSVTHYEAIMAEQGTELGPPTFGGSYSTDTDPHAATVYGGNATAGYDFDLQTSDTGTIPGGRHLKYWLRISETITYDNAPPSSSVSWTEHEFILQKVSCYDASVTTRRTYGQPNKGGELPTDANAPLRFVKYGAWDYHGGVFLGNMPDSVADKSGTARIELFPQGGSTYDQDYALAALSVFDMGKRTAGTVTGAIDTGVYVPSSNGSTTESNVTWDNQLSITPGAVSGGSTYYDTNPYSDVTLTDGNSNDYVIFKLPTSTTAAPNNSLYGLVLAIVSESSTISAGTQCWHYFASKEYQTGQSSFPGTDSVPRVWLIQMVS